MKFFLHDAVYLYLRTVNQTLAEGNADYRDGRLIRNKTMGQSFVGRCARIHSLNVMVVLRGISVTVRALEYFI